MCTKNLTNRSIKNILSKMDSYINDELTINEDSQNIKELLIDKESNYNNDNNNDTNNDNNNRHYCVDINSFVKVEMTDDNIVKKEPGAETDKNYSQPSVGNTVGILKRNTSTGFYTSANDKGCLKSDVDDLDNSLNNATNFPLLSEKNVSVIDQSSLSHTGPYTTSRDDEFLDDDSMSTLACGQCPSQMGHLQLHILSAHSNERTHACDRCSYRAFQKGGLKRHIQSVHTEKLHTCSQCSYKATEQRNLRRHIQSVHDKERPHVCQICPYKASQKLALQRHMQSIHLDEKPHVCLLCPYKASQILSLKRHIQSVHSNIKTHSCSHCTYRTSRKSFLNLHIQSVHNKEKPHGCMLCSYKAAQKGNLKMHMQSIHGKELTESVIHVKELTESIHPQS